MMTDREKVIKGLEICATGTVSCSKCPMQENCKGTSNAAMAAALELLKARPLTLDEVREDKPFTLWVEDLDTGALVFPVAYVGGLYVDRAEDWSVDPDHRKTPEYYGKRWRFWTLKPTNEQRQAVKWDDKA